MTQSTNVLENRPVIAEHPLTENSYIFLTKQIAILYKKTNDWIQNRMPGAVIYGESRMGKSTAIRYLMASLKATWGNKANFYSMITKTDLRLTDKTFFEGMLRAVGHPEISKGTITDKRNRLTNLLIARASSTNTRKIVFFIDEAQKLTDTHFDFYMDISNELDANGIALISILVGQSELLKKRGSLKGYRDMIRNRFFLESCEFQGLLTKGDFQLCLNQYDKELKYPTNSDWSFTRYYFPEQFNSGFRLTNYTDIIYDSFWKIQQKYHLTSFEQVPMQYLVNFIRVLLIEYGIDGENCWDLSEKQISDAIKKGLYEQWLN